MKLFKRKKPSGFFLLGVLTLITLVLLPIILFVSWVVHIDKTWSPLIEPRIREKQNTASIRVLARDQQNNERWIGSFTSGRLEERQSLKLAELPPLLVQSIVVLEDPRFLDHGGFDVFGILRATIVNLKSLRYRQGGSTLTQQLVKNVFLNNERTLSRKLTELILAALVENRFSKDEILEAYINEIYLGQLGSVEIHGVGRASNYYFNKPLAEIELHEMALMAAMIAGPGYYSPWRHPDRTLARRNRVLASLLDANLILQEEHDQAIEKALPPPSNYAAPTRAAYLMEALREQLLNIRTESEILKGGFDLTLGVDLELQELSEKTLLERAKNEDSLFQAAIIAISPTNCIIRAYAGGTNFRVTQLDRIRQSTRPIGSLLKPLITAPLIDKGEIHLATQLDDQPLDWTYDKGRGNWKPNNYDKKFRGKTTLRHTLEESLNVPLVRIFFDRWPDGNMHSALDPIKALGLNIPTERALPSALLGAIEQKPWDVALAYTKFVRQALGLADTAADFDCELRFEEKNNLDNGNEDFKNENPYGINGARLSIAALEGALRRGTSRALGSSLPTNQQWAGKTGTSSDQRDSWYVALSPELVVLTWTGRDDNTVTNLTGASGAMPLARPLILNWSQRPKQAQGWSWPQPEELVWKIVETARGCLASETTEMLIRSGLENDPASTPPPEPFVYQNTHYVFELFDSDKLPEFCEEL